MIWFVKKLESGRIEHSFVARIVATNSGVLAEFVTASLNHFSTGRRVFLAKNEKREDDEAWRITL